MPQDIKEAVTAEEMGAGVDAELLREMVEAGLHYGKSKSKTKPHMKPYIFGTRNTIEIVDLSHTAKLLESALEFLASVRQKGGQILFVGATPAAKGPTERIAKKFNMPYVVTRWLGGTLTNFKTISERIRYFKKLKEDEASGVLKEKYTKLERTRFNKEIIRMTELFGGLEVLNTLPQAVFIINAEEHDTAVREARITNIPVVALIGTNQDPDLITHPIPGNDTAPSSVEWVVKKAEEALEKAPPKPAEVPAVKTEAKK